VASDTDGDGIVDHLDLDSDNDGAFDLIESGVADANYDGMIDNFADNDADGIQDNVDVDVTGGADADGDGIDDVADADFVGGLDTDLDGIIDALDVDADGNGIVDVLEDVPVLGAALPDIDNNNIPDVFEANSSDVARAALSGHGCAVSTHKHASKDPIMFLLMLIAGLFTFRQKNEAVVIQDGHTRFQQSG